MNLKTCLLSCATIATVAVTAHASVDISVDAGKIGPEIQPTMYGLFFEDINYGADGGLYAEKIKNRSFEFPQNLAGWITFGNVELKNDGPFERNPHYVSLSAAGHNDKHTGLDNEGFFGVSCVGGEKYRFSVWARSPKGANLDVQLIDSASTIVAKERIKVTSPEWKKYSVEITPSRTVNKGKMRLFLAKPDDTVLDLEHVSLFPVDTWKGHENGLRKDLAQALADIHPGVFRFPGGCIVEGTQLPDRYQWKNTVGPVENRPLNQNRWHYTFTDRFYPDYYQSNGLGFYEYFLLAEEMGAAPLPVLNVGMACQYQNRTLDAHVPVDSLDEYIQDAIDLVEFANGPVDSKWGALRAEMGHPEPFGLKYLAIGNEQWGPEYVERLAPFVKALREKCPEIQIVGSSGPSPDGDKFDYLWPEMRRLGVDLVDEHYYCNEDWFRDNAARYDNYPRKGTKVFAGEYACHPKGRKYNLYDAAIHEAAFMTGLERNADVVYMATYAPLFAHKEGWQWRPDMIWFDNLSRYLSSSYYVQKMYAHNKGTNMISVTSNGTPLTGQDGLYASGAYDKDKNAYMVKIVNLSDKPQEVNVDLNKLPKKSVIAGVEIETMTPADQSPECDTPSIETKSLPVTQDSKAKNRTYVQPVVLPAKSFSIVSFTLK